MELNDNINKQTNKKIEFEMHCVNFFSYSRYMVLIIVYYSYY